MKQTTYFIGIGGIGMSALANYLLDQGEAVAGSDLKNGAATTILIERGASITFSQNGEGVQSGMRVVYSSAVKEDNGDLLKAKELGLPLFHRSELLFELAKESKTCAFAGTHGKTTTSSLMAHTLFCAGKDPSYLLGGHVASLNRNGKWGKGELCVFEADESDGSFTRYFPSSALITNIDSDHLDHYKSFENLQKAFQTFISQVKEGPIVYCADDPILCSMVEKGMGYGFSQKADARIENLRQEGFSLTFDLHLFDKKIPDIRLPLTGRHNALNGAGVFVMAYLAGLSVEEIKKAFLSFKGVGKRMELMVEKEGKKGFHDYAHHPTEIQTTLEGLRMAEPNKKILAIFQPHRYSRTKQCLGSLEGVFSGCDQVVVTDVFAAGETNEEGFKIEEVLKKCPRGSSYIPRGDVEKKLGDFFKEFDLVITLGAGDIGAIYR